MSQAVLALHCPTKEDYLTALKYIQSRHPKCLWIDGQGLFVEGEYESIMKVIEMAELDEPGELSSCNLCLVLRQKEGKVDLAWSHKNYCNYMKWMIIPAVNFRVDQNTIPSRMSQEGAEKGNPSGNKEI